MRLMIRFLMVLAAVSVSTGMAEARVGTTTTALALRAAPSPKAGVLLTMPAGAKVQISTCAHGWCKVSWQSQAGYARQSGLAVQVRRSVARAPADGGPGELWPIYPPYPYRAGHYPKADWYHAMPPYVAISPSFYRKRHFMMAQERNRYRYMPHIFRGDAYDDNGGAIENVDMQRISGTLRESYSD
ncbi:MAG: SH3 domain-containing protein [Methyloceanibacter sp.]